jgi:SAC3 family protein LENG8/THP3
VKHALDVQRAISSGNYHSLFLLYDEAPNMSGYIMDHFVDRERTKALIVITKAQVLPSLSISIELMKHCFSSYKKVSLTFLAKELAFESSPEQAKEYLTSHGLAFFLNPNSPDSEKTLDCKAAAAQLATVYEQKYRKVGIKGAI